MLFDFLDDIGKNGSSPPLIITIKFIDGSLVTAHAKDMELQFKTTFGVTTLLLSQIRRIRNVSCLQTLRNIARLNKLRVWCKDGNRFVGVPKSPAYLPVEMNGGSHSGGKIKLCEIQAMKVRSDDRESHNRQA